MTHKAIQDLDDSQTALTDSLRHVRCAGRSLYDSETNEPVEPAAGDIVDYLDAIVESLECPQPEGHVLYRERRVYAR